MNDKISSYTQIAQGDEQSSLHPALAHHSTHPMVSIHGMFCVRSLSSSMWQEDEAEFQKNAYWGCQNVI